MSRPGPNVQPLIDELVSQAGGYLRNAIRDRTTCQVCATPVEGGWPRCIPCNEQRKSYGGDLADVVACLFYGIEGAQSAFTMYRYKDPRRPSAKAQQVVILATIAGLLVHGPCAGRRVGGPVTHWAVVPSSKGRTGDHPFRTGAVGFAPGAEVTATCSITAGTRQVDPSLYALPTMPSGSHLLILDDTWTTGAHAQSMALAARVSGAEKVSILAVSRWLRPAFGDNAGFIAQRLTNVYNPMQCPWTGGICPT